MRSRCREAPLALQPSAETARVLADGLVASGLDKLPWSKPLKQWRDRVMFLRRAEGEVSTEFLLDLSDYALAAQREDMADARALRQDLAEGGFVGRSVGCADDAVALGIARAAGARSADAFRGADRHHARDRLRGRAGADHCGEVWQELFGLNTHPLIAKGKVPLVLGAAVAGAAPAGAGDARPAGIFSPGAAAMRRFDPTCADAIRDTPGRRIR